ncbi:MAG: hypothetical protein H6918_11775 [Sphingomonadaceae bacterium]|nr:hypothetical protein [Sphingomonadaceae bacterium]
MQQALHITALPDDALEAAGVFHAEWLPKARELLAGDAESLVLVMAFAGSDHADWRRAVVRDLARAHAPKRVNCVVGDAESAVAATLAYLEMAPGVTGQLLPVDSQGAGNPAG